MSTDPSDSAYDLAPVPRIRPRGTPSPPPEPVQLAYRRIEPVVPAAPVPEQPKQVHKLSTSEWLFYVLRMLGCVAIIGAGILWLVFIDHHSLAGMVIGFFLIGIGFSLFLFAGPSSAEKKGYHF